MTRQKNRPALIAAQHEWFRFSSYEIVQTPHGYYIRPTKKAQLSWYRPFGDPHLLLDYLNLGRNLERLEFSKEVIDPNCPRCGASGVEIPRGQRRCVQCGEQWPRAEERKAQRVLAFVEKFGLPGTLWQCDPLSDFTTEGRQVFLKASYWAVPIHRRFGSGGFPLPNSSQVLSFFLADGFGLDDALSFRSRGFLQAYAEPVFCVERDARRLLEFADDWERYKSMKSTPGDAFIDADRRQWRMSWKERFTDVAANNIGLALSLDYDQVRIDYRFTSLISALHVMFARNVAGSEKRIRLCALSECREPFMARNERARYCCDSHSNLDRQRAFLNRKKQIKGVQKDGRQRKTTKTRR